MVNSDIPETFEGRSLDEFLNKNKSPQSTTSFAQLHSDHDDLEDVFRAKAEKQKFAQVRQEKGENLVAKWAKNTYETQHVCQECKRYGYLESLPEPKFLVECAISFAYPQYAGSKNWHLRRHVIYHHGEQLYPKAEALYNKSCELNNLIISQKNLKKQLESHTTPGYWRDQTADKLHAVEYQINELLKDSELMEKRAISEQIHERDKREYLKGIGALHSATDDEEYRRYKELVGEPRTI